jgi:hypothetical protein
MFWQTYLVIIMLTEQRCPTVSDELLHKLRCILPENIILAALDIIDCECGEFNRNRIRVSRHYCNTAVIKYTTPHSYPQYEVLGSTATYSVFLDMALAPMPFHCSCPAFSYVVLGSKSHIMVGW